MKLTMSLAVLMSVLPVTGFAMTADEMIEGAIQSGSVNEMMNQDQVILIPVVEAQEEEGDCEGSPCPNELYGSANLYTSGVGARVGYVPVKNLRVEIGYQGTQDHYARGLILGTRYVIPGGTFEVGGRYLPYDASKASQEIKDKFLQFGYEVRVNFAHISFSETTNGVGSAKGIRLFAVVSSERKDLVPQVGLGGLFYFRKINN